MSYIIVIAMFNLIPFLFYYFFGCFANVKMMYKMKRADVPHFLKIFFLFTGLRDSKSGRPSFICFIFEVYAWLSMLILDAGCIIALFFCETVEELIVPVRFSLGIAIAQMVIWVCLVISIPFYVKYKRKHTHRKK